MTTNSCKRVSFDPTIVFIDLEDIPVCSVCKRKKGKKDIFKLDECIKCHKMACENNCLMDNNECLNCAIVL